MPIARAFIGDAVTAISLAVNGLSRKGWAIGTGPDILVNPDATLSVREGGASTTFSLRDTGTYFDGDYQVDNHLLDRGPVCLIAPRISGLPLVGETLIRRPGLWAGRDVHGPITHPAPGSWQRDGLAISGHTAESYVVTESDKGHDIRFAETLGNAAGSVSAPSAPIAIALPGALPDAFNGAAGTSIVGYLGESGIAWSGSGAALDGEGGLQSATSNSISFIQRLDEAGTDYVVTVGLRMSGSSGLGPAVRVSDSKTGVYVRHNGADWRMYGYRNGAQSQIGKSFGRAYDPDAEIVTRFECRGDTFRFYQGEELLISGTSTNFPTGRGGSRVHSSGGLRYRNFHVEALA